MSSNIDLYHSWFLSIYSCPLPDLYSFLTLARCSHFSFISLKYFPCFIPVSSPVPIWSSAYSGLPTIPCTCHHTFLAEVFAHRPSLCQKYLPPSACWNSTSGFCTSATSGRWLLSPLHSDWNPAPLPPLPPWHGIQNFFWKISLS